MPKRVDLNKILVIGSGPIANGESCELDYSATQACKALRAAGCQVVLVNSNAATIMTDLDTADVTYIEPLTTECVAAIIRREQPDALLPTVGGETALKVAMALSDSGILSEGQVELIGPNQESRRIPHDRVLFKQAMKHAGLRTLHGEVAHSLEEARGIVEQIGYPAVIRPVCKDAAGVAADSPREFDKMVASALAASPVGKALIEESVHGWKELELEVMSDRAGDVAIICSLESFDVVGLHRGNSIVVAPAQTLSSAEERRLRAYAIRAIRAIGLKNGTGNIRFAINPANGEIRVVKIIPRVSYRSSLASKAAGVSIAKCAARLAIGYTVAELNNLERPATNSVAIRDCVVVKIPTWDFEMFPEARDYSGTQVKSAGEAIAVGRTFGEALFKGLRSVNAANAGRFEDVSDDELKKILARPSARKLAHLCSALKQGIPIDQLQRWSQIDRWFLEQLRQVIETQSDVRGRRSEELSVGTGSGEVRPGRRQRKILMLGSGPNRSGQGIEFDYCCSQAGSALREAGYEAIILSCNPQTDSIDHDVADRFYLERLTFEDVMKVVDLEKPEGLIVQFGGQTALNLALRLQQAGAPILGTSPDCLELAGDRQRFSALLRELRIPQPENGIASNAAEARALARRLGYPVVVRPSCGLGARSLVVIDDDESLEHCARQIFASNSRNFVVIERFLARAAAFDVAALADETRCVIAGIQEYIEDSGVHSEDSSSVLPPVRIDADHLESMRHYTRKLARVLAVRGLLNIRFALKDHRVYVLGVYPRAARTLPFVSKATGVPLARIAALVMTGKSLKDFDLPDDLTVNHFFIKSPIFSFPSFPGVDPIGETQLRATGEVMGTGESFGEAFGKAILSTGFQLPRSGKALFSISEGDRGQGVLAARRLVRFGFQLMATAATAARIREVGLEVETVEVNDAAVRGQLKAGQIALVITTSPGGLGEEEQSIRQLAVQHNVLCATTMAAGRSIVDAIAAQHQNGALHIRSLQELQEAHAFPLSQGAEFIFHKRTRAAHTN